MIREFWENHPKNRLFAHFSTLSHPVRRDAAPRRVPTTRQAGARRRRIIDVHIIGSLNRVTNLSTTPGNMLFGPLSSLAAHHHRFSAVFFKRFAPMPSLAPVTGAQPLSRISCKLAQDIAGSVAVVPSHNLEFSASGPPASRRYPRDRAICAFPP